MNHRNRYIGLAILILLVWGLFYLAQTSLAADRKALCGTWATTGGMSPPDATDGYVWLTLNLSQDGTASFDLENRASESHVKFDGSWNITRRSGKKVLTLTALEDGDPPRSCEYYYCLSFPTKKTLKTKLVDQSEREITRVEYLLSGAVFTGELDRVSSANSIGDSPVSSFIFYGVVLFSILAIMVLAIKFVYSFPFGPRPEVDGGMKSVAPTPVAPKDLSARATQTTINGNTKKFCKYCGGKLSGEEICPLCGKAINS